MGHRTVPPAWVRHSQANHEAWYEVNIHLTLTPIFHSRNVGGCSPDGDRLALTQTHERGESCTAKIWDSSLLADVYALSRGHGYDEFTAIAGQASAAHTQPRESMACASKNVASQQR